MIKLPWTKRNNVKKVKLDIINAIELKPDANYILVVDSKTIKRTEVEYMLRDMHKHGIKNIVSFMLAGAPEDAIQLVSRDSLRNGKTSKSRRVSHATK